VPHHGGDLLQLKVAHNLPPLFGDKLGAIIPDNLGLLARCSLQGYGDYLSYFLSPHRQSQLPVHNLAAVRGQGYSPRNTSAFSPRDTLGQHAIPHQDRLPREPACPAPASSTGKAGHTCPGFCRQWKEPDRPHLRRPPSRQAGDNPHGGEPWHKLQLAFTSSGRATKGDLGNLPHGPRGYPPFPAPASHNRRSELAQAQPKSKSMVGHSAPEFSPR